jgi:hypothetical protein
MNGWTANVPDNIAHAAHRLNPGNSPSLAGYTVGAVISAGYTTCTTRDVSGPCDAGTGPDSGRCYEGECISRTL